MKVSGKMQVQVFHGNHLGISASGSPALDTEAGAQGRLSQGYDGVFPHPAKGLPQPHGGGGFALTGRRGVDGCHQHQLSVLFVFYLFPQFICELGFIFAVKLQVILRNPVRGSSLLNGLHYRFLSNLNV